MTRDPVTWAILGALAVNTVLRWRTYRIEQRRLRFESQRRAINKHDLAHLILEGDPQRLASLGIEVAR